MNIVDYLNQFEKFTTDPTLEAMKFLMDKLGNPEKKLKFIHVAGTNGKGSICEMLSSILVKQGYRVGKFISPYLIDFKETISINGITISDQEVEKIVGSARCAAQGARADARPAPTLSDKRIQQ